MSQMIVQKLIADDLECLIIVTLKRVSNSMSGKSLNLIRL